jgi:predicted regulator of Ras-like GTPase activity (Roadblock/LC7/MglB family)
MALSHHKYFEQITAEITTLASNTTVAIVSIDGMVLDSNIPDGALEAQLSSFASVYLDYGKKMLAIPARDGQRNAAPDKVQTTVTVGAERFIIITQLVADAMLIIVGEDKTKLNDILKKSLEEIDHVNSMIREKEILF